MMTKLFIAGAVLGMASMVAAQDHEHCPMAAGQDHRADVDRRHDDTTGVDHAVSEHHFLLAQDGGSIRLEVTDAANVVGRDRIRAHLQAIARAFAAGDFAMPMHIHDQTPPGADVMSARKDVIRYAYTATGNGGLVTLSTNDGEARVAIHRFLRFQIGDHGTADSAQ
jgi:hypothetical protein